MLKLRLYCLGKLKMLALHGKSEFGECCNFAVARTRLLLSVLHRLLVLLELVIDKCVIELRA